MAIRIAAILVFIFSAAGVFSQAVLERQMRTNLTGIARFDSAATPSITTTTFSSEFAGSGTGAAPLKLAQQGASAGDFLKWSGTAWVPGGEVGTGTVTSVALSMPSGFTVTGSPITSSGTFSVSLSSQSASYVLISPLLGGVPTFRALDAGDLPYFTSERITDFTEAAQDVAGALIVSGSGISVSYNDAGNSLTVSNTGILGSGSTNRIPYFSSSNTVTSSAGLTFNPTMTELNIGSGMTEVARLNIALSSGATTDTVMRFEKVGGWGLTQFEQRYSGGDKFFHAGDGTNRILTLRSNNALTSTYVGINNIAPAQALDVTGAIRFSGAIMPNNNAGTSGYFLTSAGAGSPPTWTQNTFAGGSGASGRAAFWSGTSTISSNAAFLFDNTNTRLQVGTISSHTPEGRLNIGTVGGATTETAVEIVKDGGWLRSWIKTFANTTTSRRGITFGGVNNSGTDVNDVLVVSPYTSGRVAVNKPQTDGLDYSFEVASATDIDGIYVSRSGNETLGALFHVNSDGDGIMRSKSGYWTFGDIDISAAGQNPSAILHLFGNAGATIDPIFRLEKSGGYGLTLFEQGYTAGPGSKEFYIGDGTNRILTLKSDNTLVNTFVGISQTNPTAKLDVSGDLRVTTRTGTATNVGGWTSDNKAANVTIGTGLALSSGTLSATDASTTNEIQTYAHSGTTSYTNTLSNSGGSFTLQSGSGITLSHTAGTTTITATDASASNELQTYAHSGTTSYTNTLSNSGGAFTLQAGTGATISHSAGTVTISATGTSYSAGNGLTLSGTTFSVGGTLTAGITLTTGDQLFLIEKGTGNTGTGAPFGVKVNNNYGDRTAINIYNSGGTATTLIGVTEEGQSYFTHNGGAGYMNFNVASTLFRFTEAARFVLPTASTHSTETNAFYAHSEGLFFYDGVADRAVAYYDREIKGSGVTTHTGAGALGGEVIFNIADASGGAFTLNVGTDLREGVEYKVRCRGNGTNLVTFSATSSCNFHIDSDSTSTRTSFTSGGAGTGYQAPYLIYRFARYGTTIFVDL